MPIKGISLKEVNNIVNEIKELKCRLNCNMKSRDDILNYGVNYNKIKKSFQEITRYLNYTYDADISKFYRIRKNKNNQPFKYKHELIYPEPNMNHTDRMNNTNFRVLYVSLNEHTAMAEVRIDDSYIGKYFQLTRFSTDKNLIVYKLGIFSELYLNSPRDSCFVKKKMKSMFGSESHDKTIQGYSALECAVADILYDTDENYYILSPILAEAIFDTNSKIDAILYPSLQNRYGMNLAIKKECADKLKISCTMLNKLDKVYPNGFYKYYTKKECLDFDDTKENKFYDVKENATYR